jgi:hypothetical protein
MSVKGSGVDRHKVYIQDVDLEVKVILRTWDIEYFIYLKRCNATPT